MPRYSIEHTYLTGAWKLCSRCDTRQKVNEMQWQRGLLLCSDCLDTGVFPLTGQRDIAIAEVLGDGKEELAPVEKLREPQSYNEQEDFLL